ncbi:glycosyltransferase family 4 protein [Priestia megaterium]|uniref:glycosyltransferase family 4 protein n=1 Tax=Priestia megaterium TaxID=1404 RepID=UPI0033919134
MKNKRKRILYFHHGGTQAGAARSLSFLINRIDLDKYDPYVVYVTDENNKQLFENVKAKTIYVPSIRPFHGSTVARIRKSDFLKQTLKLPLTITSARKIIKEVNPDIIHLNSTCLWPVALASKGYKKTLPVVCHIREPLLNNFYGKILSEMSYKYVDSFISIDKYDATTVKTETKMLSIIYNFVDFSIYNPNISSNYLRKLYHLNENDIVFLYLARITPPNGAKEMLIALNNMLITNPHFHLFIVGDVESNNDAYTIKVRELAKKYSNVHIIGFEKNETVVNIIASSDVHVCSFVEPHFSRAIIEAGAIGKPSIATNIGGPEELIVDGKTGFLCKEDFSNLEELCLRLGNNKELRKYMGNNAYEYAMLNFNADQNAQETFNVYEDLLDPTKGIV